MVEKETAETTAMNDGERFRLLFENIGARIGYYDEKGTIIFCNRAEAESMGYRPEEVMGKSIFDLLDRSRADTIYMRIQRALTGTEEPGLYEEEVFLPTGTALFLSLYLPVRNPKGNVKGVQTISIDISEKKKSKETKEESQKRLADILDLLPDATLAIDLDGRVIAWNRALEEMTGVPADEILGKSDHEYSIPFYGERRPILLDLVLMSDEEFEKKYDYIKRDGEMITSETFIPGMYGGKGAYLWGTATPSYDTRGNRTGAIEVIRDISDRKRTEREIEGLLAAVKEEKEKLSGLVDALHESEARFKSLFENMTMGVAIYKAIREGEDFEFKDINKAAERIDNLIREDVIGHRVLEIFPSIKEFGLFEVFQRVWETGIAENHPTSIYKDKRIAGWRENYVIKLPSGEIVAIYQDVTEKKQAEEQRAFLSAIIEHSNDGIIGKTLDGVITSWNAGAERIYGYTAEEMIGRQISLLVPPGDVDNTRTFLERIRAGESVPYIETTRQTKDGRIIDVALTVSPIKDREGNLIGASTIIRDISEQKAAEEALRQSEERLRSYIENAPDGIFLVDNEGNYTMVNDAACEMTGYSRDELLQKNLIELVYPDDHAIAEVHFKRVNEEGQASGETRYVTKNGDICYWLVKAVRISKKRLLGFASDITDQKLMESEIRSLNAVLEQKVEERTEELLKEISHRKEIEDQLRASLDEKSLLLREIHHRVKNNLQIIISLTNLQLRQSDDPQVKRIMAETQNRVRAMALVHEKLYRSDNIYDIDLAEYIRFLTKQLFAYYKIDSRNVLHKTEIGEIRVPINTAIPIGLIINELVSNALKHGFPDGRKGTLSISARREDDTIFLEVDDTGVGIAEGIDWRNAPSLGLKLVISLVKQLEGTIELDRSHGTAFSMVLQVKK